MQRPMKRVKFTKAIARHTKTRDQNPSLGYICPGEPHQRTPNAPKFQDWFQEETSWQEHWAHWAAWKLAKKILELIEKKKTTVLSPTEKWCLPSPSKIKAEEREFVVDSGASMHMTSRKDLNSAEMETVTTSRCPTTVITANGEVQTHEEVKVLEDTLGVLSLGKLCDEHGYSYEWTNFEKPCLIKNCVRIQCNTENYVPNVVLGKSTTSSSSSSSRTTPPTSSQQESTGSTPVPASVECESADEKERWDPSSNPTKIPKPNQN